MGSEALFNLAVLRRPALAFTLAAAAFCFQNPLQQAVVLTRAGRFAEARRLLKGIAEPSELAQRIAFHRLKAAIASGLGSFVEGAAEMHAALALAPADGNLLLATAAAELKADDLVSALNHARSAGETPTAFALIGDIEEKRAQTASALEAYRHAAALAPGDEQYRLALARELIQHQVFGDAIDGLKAARPLFPQSARLLVLLGIAHYGAGDNQEAVDSLIEASKLEPNFEPAYRCLSQIVLQTSAPPSEKVYQTLCAWNAIVCAALQLRQARENSDETLAQRAINQLGQAPRSNSIAHCALGRAYEERKQLSTARRELELCVAQDGSPQNRYTLALLYQRLGETSLARKELATRAALLHSMSEQTAASLAALQAFTER